jgi:8-oxo-dGTP diphosphatase
VTNDELRTTNVQRLCVVAAAVVERDDAFLLTRRQAGVHLEGCWEFPGGKCEAGEPLDACLARELREELAVGATVGGELMTVGHDYPDRRVELHFLSCDLVGEPSPQQGQEMRWVPRAGLADLEFPPADAALIRMLTKPTQRERQDRQD